MQELKSSWTRPEKDNRNNDGPGNCEVKGTGQGMMMREKNNQKKYFKINYFGI